MFSKGRIGFYDQYGVIRDVLQNHLTEVMTLLTMRLPVNVNNSEEILENKLQLLGSILALGKDQAVIGQYQAYKAEVQQELNKTKDHVSRTPTFAGEYRKTFFCRVAAQVLYHVLKMLTCDCGSVFQPCWRTSTTLSTKAFRSS